ncbi:MAG TPA: 23S rRNA (pseudouridine(1915)-N(3))-methyltransferase RlmH [bacterium]|nr:23S rRNA (pseudouridine(1915)-N(3))-methyltransferase RlmH [bacterium]
MRIRILTPGKTKAGHIAAGQKKYLNRLQPYTKIELVLTAAVKVPARPSPADIKGVKMAEAKNILKSILPGEYVIALAETGQQFSSPELAAFLQRLLDQGNSRLAFIIGGPLGLAPEILQRAQQQLSLSTLTFTHEQARLILLEQLYRCFKINSGQPYHY